MQKSIELQDCHKRDKRNVTSELRSFFLFGIPYGAKYILRLLQMYLETPFVKHYVQNTV